MWPGQVVQCVSCMAWTKEVEEAIATTTLPEYAAKCTIQVGQLVELVRKELTRCSTITIEALIVIDVHGIIFPFQLYSEFR